MVEVLSTGVVIRVVGVYMATVIYSDTNVMFTDEIDTYYLLTLKFIIDVERFRMSGVK